MSAQSMLETERLYIRIDREEDYVRTLLSEPDEYLKAYLGLETEPELQAQKAKAIGGMSTYRTAVRLFHFLLKETDKVIGNFAYHNWYPMHRRSEIGYLIHATANRGKGYMREALPVLLRYGFEEMNLNRIEAFIHPDNQPSRRVVERAGFVQEGTLREHYVVSDVAGDSVVSGLLRADYVGH